MDVKVRPTVEANNEGTFYDQAVVACTDKTYHNVYGKVDNVNDLTDKENESFIVERIADKVIIVSADNSFRVTFDLADPSV